ncbi:cupin domain-containing protein [Yeosuana sp. MJ-SS3]|uniref:Cupin domain-containing protein n=1 Tax=Gilvirhabdus luticola TaxID=3079858 RepID=A0ABU3U8J6_9FLAO|nr:cupin domain-containing protein [Yeosuana sp. MJ-SS3]MDU8886410.1 cupin domain-containing protein [Yeosuana sp. MJ-SS3]
MISLKLIYYIILLNFFILSCKQQPNLPDPSQAGWKGHKVCEVLEDNDKVKILKCTFPSGIGHEKHRHKPHFGYTLAGSKFRMVDKHGVKELDVPTGYSFYKDSVTVHEALNIGDSTAVFLIIEPK